MVTILYCFCKFYDSIQIIEKFKSWKFTELNLLFNSTFLLEINELNWSNQFLTILKLNYLNCFSHIQILNSINQIVKLQSIIWIDCNSNTEWNILYCAMIYVKKNKREKCYIISLGPEFRTVLIHPSFSELSIFNNFCNCINICVYVCVSVLISIVFVNMFVFNVNDLVKSCNALDCSK
jgi:hypothetical protein